MRPLALSLLLVALLLPSLSRRAPSSPPRRCAEEGRGAAPRHWLGCAADGGAPRDLSGDERLLLGLPLDLNRATARELAFVPGLSPVLGAEVVAEREAGGPYPTVEALLRVRGIGPVRLERSRPWLTVAPGPVGMANDAE
jgi:competence protein ComEA